MKLERLIFKNDKGEFVDIPASEIESLYSELGKLLDGLAVKKAKPESKETDDMKQMRELAKTLQEKQEKECEEFQRRQSPMPSNWPPQVIPGIFGPRFGDPAPPQFPGLYQITCEQQPLRFEWDGVEGDKVRLRTTQQYRFTTSAPA